jgi:hypothetical protein
LVYRAEDREFIRQPPTDDEPAGEFNERAADCMSGACTTVIAVNGLAESSLVVSHKRTDAQRDGG